MVVRLISAKASDIATFTKEDLKQSIKASEGRVVLSENVCAEPAVLGELTSSEIAKSFGADMILLNCFDVFNPVVYGINNFQSPDEHVIKKLKHLVGLPIGLNLEPVDEKANLLENQAQIANGRKASVETFKKANELGFDFVLLTGNPGTGVSNSEITKAVITAKEHFSGLIFAGKMHGAGVNEPVVNLASLEEFVDNGADVLLVPAVGSVPGVSEDEVRAAVELARSKDALVISAIGTSQEGADEAVVREIALKNKICGVDIQHIGDANMGLVGIRNITVLSDAIRGARHTVARIATSVNR